MTFFSTEFHLNSHKATEDELKRINDILENIISDNEPED